MSTAYDLHSYGKRVAAVAALDQSSVVEDKVVFVFNFADYLRKIAPGRKMSLTGTKLSPCQILSAPGAGRMDI